MARKRHTDEAALRLLREIEVDLAAWADVSEAFRQSGISDATSYNWRREFGGIWRSQLSEMRARETENKRLKTSRSDGRTASVAGLELVKLILKRRPADARQTPGRRLPAIAERESLDFLKPKARLNNSARPSLRHARGSARPSDAPVTSWAWRAPPCIPPCRTGLTRRMMMHCA